MDGFHIEICNSESYDKLCFCRYVSKGKRLLKNQQLVEELEKSLDDKVEKEKLVEGFLGYIICSTQVISSWRRTTVWTTTTLSLME
jgi:hypothetical protein